MSFFAGAIVGKAFLDTKAWTAGAKSIEASGTKLQSGFKAISAAAKVAGDIALNPLCNFELYLQPLKLLELL